MAKIKGPDIIASNIGMVGFIVGSSVDPLKHDLEALTVELKRNGQTVNRGKSGNVYKGQWKTAKCLINSMLQKGRPVEPGHIILTGALGKMIPGKSSKYTADFGKLGVLSFRIRCFFVKTIVLSQDEVLRSENERDFTPNEDDVNLLINLH
jgi:2-keto-4-pentenoate hydratase